MKRGSAALGLVGVALAIVGVVIAIVSSAALGIALVVIGLVAMVLAVSDWAEFSADVKGLLGVKVTRHSSQAPPDGRVLIDLWKCRECGSTPQRNRVRERAVGDGESCSVMRGGACSGLTPARVRVRIGLP